LRLRRKRAGENSRVLIAIVSRDFYDPPSGWLPFGVDLTENPTRKSREDLGVGFFSCLSGARPMTLAVDRLAVYKIGKSFLRIPRHPAAKGLTHYEVLPKGGVDIYNLLGLRSASPRSASRRSRLLRWDRTLLYTETLAAMPRCYTNIYRIVIVCGIVINMYFYCCLTLRVEKYRGGR